MSENNDQQSARRSARDRMWEDRRRQEVSAKRTRTAKAAVAVAGVLGAAGLIAVLATQSGGSADDAAGGGKSAPITEGEAKAPVTLSVYEDFRCPGCAQFEQGFKDTINELREAGKVKVDYHLVAIVDRSDGSNGSTNAANAAACAKDAGQFTALHDALFAKQPEHGEDAYADKKNLLEIARDVQGLDTEEFRDCVREGTHDDWVKRSTEAFGDSDYDATPTLLMDGENLSADRTTPFTPDDLVAKVEEAAGKS